MDMARGADPSSPLLDTIVDELRRIDAVLKRDHPLIDQLLGAGRHEELWAALKASPDGAALVVRYGELLSRAKAILDPYNLEPR